MLLMLTTIGRGDAGLPGDYVLNKPLDFEKLSPVTDLLLIQVVDHKSERRYYFLQSF